MTDRLIQSFEELADLVVHAVPKLLVGLVLLVLALGLAKLAERLVRALLVRAKFDSLVGRLGVDGGLQRMGIRQPLNQLLPRLTYFLLLLLFARTAADALELDAISDALGALFSYLPNVVAAVLLLVIGSAVGKFVGRTVAQAAEESGLEFADSLGRIVTALLVFVVGVMAVGQLRIETDIVRLVTSLVLAGLALAFGLSFGLGTTPLTRNLVAGFYARKVLRVGDEITVAGVSGRLEAITSTHAVVQAGAETITVANVRLLDEVATQKPDQGS